MRSSTMGDELLGGLRASTVRVRAWSPLRMCSTASQRAEHGDVNRSRPSPPARVRRTPYHVVGFATSRFIATLNELKARGLLPPEVQQDSVSAMDEALITSGVALEQRVLAQLQRAGVDVVSVPCGGEEGLQLTARHVRERRTVIHQAVLRDDVLSGVADFLLLQPDNAADEALIDWRRVVDGDADAVAQARALSAPPAACGAAHAAAAHGRPLVSPVPPLYSVMEVKLSSTARAEYLIQALCYADMLRKSGARCAQQMYLWLSGSHEGSAQAVRTDSYENYFASLRAEYLAFLGDFEARARALRAQLTAGGDASSIWCALPQPDGAPERLRPWSALARELWQREDSLHLVAGMRRSQVAALRSAGVNTLRALADVDLAAALADERGGLARMTSLLAAQRQARLQALTRERRLTEPHAPPAFEVLRPDLAEPIVGAQRRGLAMLPPASAEDVFFDMEGYPLYAAEHGRSLEYLFGYIEGGGGARRNGGEKREEAEPRFVALWAHDHAQEAEALRRLVERLSAARQRDAGMHVYHYGVYETAALQRVAAHAGAAAEDALQRLLDEDVFVDVLRVVKQGLCVGEESYSIKKVERLCELWRSSDSLADAESSVALYQRYQRALGGGQLSHAAELLAELAQYNRQDCASLAQLVEWLRGVQQREGIVYVPPAAQPAGVAAEAAVDSDASSSSASGESGDAELAEVHARLDAVRGACGRDVHRRRADAQVILDGMALSDGLLHTAGRAARPPRALQVAATDDAYSAAQTHAIAARVLDFHEREGRPARRRYRDRLRASEDELWTDVDCVSAVLVREVKRVEPSGRRRRAHLHVLGVFDSTQPLRLRAGARVALLQNASPAHLAPAPFAYGSVLQVVRGGGGRADDASPRNRVELKLPTQEAPLPRSFSVVSVDELQFCPAVMRESILRCVREVVAPEAVTTPPSDDAGDVADTLAARVLRRALPTLSDGANVATEVRAVRGDARRLAALVRRLDRSVLVVQGPPGSGKTRLSAQLLAALVGGGGSDGATAAPPLRCAVSAHSHAAADTLLMRVASQHLSPSDAHANEPANDATTRFVAKVPALELDALAPRPPGADEVAAVASLSKLPAHMRVVGATVYQLARPEARGLFDILLIDEAGQVPIANLLAMISCARRGAVLVGDQRQLDMPLEGAHDGGVALSCLEYALGENCVQVPPSRGVFLDVSYRMAPELCALISRAVYDGALRPHDSTRNNRLQFLAAATLLSAPRARLLDRACGVQFISYTPAAARAAVSAPSAAATSRGSASVAVAAARMTAAESVIEAQIVKRLVDELRGSVRADVGSSRPTESSVHVNPAGEWAQQTRERAGMLSLRDILIVAPYNQQVALLQRTLGSGCRVGTVDRFQGQEAPVVIVSMCGVGDDDDVAVDDSAGDVSTGGGGGGGGAGGWSSRRSRGAAFVLRKNRLNVALSRAQCLAIVVGSVQLARGRVSTLEDVELLNFFCRIVEAGSRDNGKFACVDGSGDDVVLDDLCGHLRRTSPGLSSFQHDPAPPADPLPERHRAASPTLPAET